MEKLSVSIGICAYNEENNLAYLLDSVFGQKTERVSIKEVIVISDGSTDGTDEIIRRIAASGRLVSLRNQRRLGKYVAINRFLKEAKSDIFVLASADIILESDAIEKLCLPFFEDESMGITGAHPVPKNRMDSFMGYVVNLEWYLHHQLSLIQPKFGEMIAFRNMIEELPPTLVDEEHIAYLFMSKGLKLEYCPDARIYNKGPETVGDFLRQRKRIYTGHLMLKRTYNYEVPTLNGMKALFCLLRNFPGSFKGKVFWLIGAIFLELTSRILARLGIIYKKNNYLWEIAKSTKNLQLQKVL